jgi:hypothetical protein
VSLLLRAVVYLVSILIVVYEIKFDVHSIVCQLPSSLHSVHCSEGLKHVTSVEPAVYVAVTARSGT